MTRGTFVMRAGRLVAKHGPEDIRPAPARSALPAPMLNLDTMGALKSMVDGQTYDSKAALRASYRAAGVEEVGNDAPREATAPGRPAVTSADVGEAFQMVRQGYKPAPLDTSIVPEA